MSKCLHTVLITMLFFLTIPTRAQKGIYSKVDSLLRIENPKNALMVLDSMDKNSDISNTSVFRYYKAKCFSSLKRTDEALKICSDQIMKLDKHDTLLHRFYFQRSFIYWDLKNAELMIQDINKAIELNPNEISYYLQASYFYGENKDYKNCFNVLEKAIIINPNDIYILNNLSYYSSMTEKFGKAIDYANEGIKLAKDYKWIGALLNNRGFANLGLKEYDKALIDINESINYFPTNSYAYYNKALVYIQLGEVENVCKNLDMAKYYGAINMTKELIDKYCK